MYGDRICESSKPDDSFVRLGVGVRISIGELIYRLHMVRLCSKRINNRLAIPPHVAGLDRSRSGRSAESTAKIDWCKYGFEWSNNTPAGLYFSY